jgi:biotin carboxyl carrier protein
LRLQVVIGGEVYEVEVEDSEEDATPDRTSSSVAPIQSTVLPTVPMPGSDLGEDDGKIYRSPVAGLVVKVRVEPGQEVKVGEVMLVLEAMKMETYIVATNAGRVKLVHAIAGAAVKLNEVLLEFE